MFDGLNGVGMPHSFGSNIVQGDGQPDGCNLVMCFKFALEIKTKGVA
jgi:hypothetical protein